jgi:hypothetical protein
VWTVAVGLPSQVPISFSESPHQIPRTTSAWACVSGNDRRTASIRWRTSTELGRGGEPHPGFRGGGHHAGSGQGGRRITVTSIHAMACRGNAQARAARLGTTG